MSFAIEAAIILVDQFDEAIADYQTLLASDPIISPPSASAPNIQVPNSQAPYSQAPSDYEPRSDPRSDPRLGPSEIRCAKFALNNMWIDVIDMNSVPKDWQERYANQIRPGLFALAFVPNPRAPNETMSSSEAEIAGPSVEQWHPSPSIPILTRSVPAPAPIKTALAVDHVVVRTADADRTDAVFGNDLGLRLALRQNVEQWGGEMLFFRTQHMSIEVVANPSHDPMDSLWGIAYRCQDMDAEIARLRSAGVTVSDRRVGRKPGTSVATVKSHTLDIPTLLIAHDGSQA